MLPPSDEATLQSSKFIKAKNRRKLQCKSKTIVWFKVEYTEKMEILTGTAVFFRAMARQGKQRKQKTERREEMREVF